MTKDDLNQIVNDLVVYLGSNDIIGEAVTKDFLDRLKELKTREEIRMKELLKIVGGPFIK